MDENESRLSKIIDSIEDKLQDQAWYQQTKSKWDELDPQSRTALRTGGLLVIVLVSVFMVFTSAISVNSKKKEIDDKLAIIRKIKNAEDELKSLKEQTQGIYMSTSQEPWKKTIEGISGEIGLAQDSITIGPEAAITLTDKNSKINETGFDVAVKKINVRQLVKFVHALENHRRTLKVKKIEVDTHPDESGYLDLKLAVSGFSTKDESK